MKNKLISKMYIAGFLIMLVVPLLLINRDDDAISEKENRPLAHFPHVHRDGGFNLKLSNEIENYVNDRIGLRNELILLNGKLQYNVFGRMENPDRYRLGPDGEFNIIEADMIETYQHKNLYTDDELNEITDSYQKIDEYLENMGCEFYLVDCYDKQTVYPEYFPDSVIQYGEISKTQQVIQALKNETDVNVVDLLPIYNELKGEYEIYGKYGDPVHWTPRGAFIGYQQILKCINENNDGAYKVRTEEDYDITITDQGMVFYGGVSHSNMSESFERKNLDATFVENCYDKYPAFEGTFIKDFTNKKAGNGTRVMIFGNSFVRFYILEDLAESFGETLFVLDTSEYNNFKERIDCYKPDIVIYQLAERYTTNENLIAAAKDFK